MNRTQLQAAGRRLYGTEWKSPLARAVGYSYRALLGFIQGKKDVDTTLELAIVGVEAIKAGFVPSWGPVKVQELTDRQRKAKRPTAVQVRP